MHEIQLAPGKIRLYLFNNDSPTPGDWQETRTRFANIAWPADIRNLSIELGGARRRHRNFQE